MQEADEASLKERKDEVTMEEEAIEVVDAAVEISQQQNSTSGSGVGGYEHKEDGDIPPLLVDWNGALPFKTPRETGMNRSFSFDEISGHLQENGTCSGTLTPLRNTRPRRATLTPASSKTPALDFSRGQNALGVASTSPRSPAYQSRGSSVASPMGSFTHSLSDRPAVREVSRSLVATLADLRAFAAEHNYTPSSQRHGNNEHNGEERGEIEVQLPVSPNRTDRGALELPNFEQAQHNDLLGTTADSITNVNPSTAVESKDLKLSTVVSSNAKFQDGIELDLDEELARLEEQFLTELGQQVDTATTQPQEADRMVLYSFSDLVVDKSTSKEKEESKATELVIGGVQSTSNDKEELEVATEVPDKDLGEKDTSAHESPINLPTEQNLESLEGAYNDFAVEAEGEVARTPRADVDKAKSPGTMSTKNASQAIDLVQSGSDAIATQKVALAGSNFTEEHVGSNSIVGSAPENVIALESNVEAEMSSLSVALTLKQDPAVQVEGILEEKGSKSTPEKSQDGLTVEVGNALEVSNAVPTTAGEESAEGLLAEPVRADITQISDENQPGEFSIGINQQKPDSNVSGESLNTNYSESHSRAVDGDSGAPQTSENITYITKTDGSKGLDTEEIEDLRPDASVVKGVEAITEAVVESAIDQSELPDDRSKSSGELAAERGVQNIDPLVTIEDCDKSDQESGRKKEDETEIDEHIQSFLTTMDKEPPIIQSTRMEEHQVSEEVLFIQDEVAQNLDTARIPMESKSSSTRHLGESISSIGEHGVFNSPEDLFAKPKIALALQERRGISALSDPSEISFTSRSREDDLLLESIHSHTQADFVDEIADKMDENIVQEPASVDEPCQEISSKNRGPASETVLDSANNERAEDIFRPQNISTVGEKRRVDSSAVSSVTSASSPSTLRMFQVTGMISPIKVDESRIGRRLTNEGPTKPPLFPRGTTEATTLHDSRHPSQTGPNEDSTGAYDPPTLSQFLKTQQSSSYNIEESVFALMEDSSSSSLSPPGETGTLVRDTGSDVRSSASSSSFGDSQGTPPSHSEGVELRPGATIWNMLSQESPRRSSMESKRPDFVVLEPLPGQQASLGVDGPSSPTESVVSDGKEQRFRRNRLREIDSMKHLKPSVTGRRGRASRKKPGRNRSFSRRQHEFRLELLKAVGGETFRTGLSDDQQESDASSYEGRSLATEILPDSRHSMIVRCFSSPDLRILETTPAAIMSELEAASPEPARPPLSRRHSVDFARLSDMKLLNSRQDQGQGGSADLSSPRRQFDRSPASHSFIESVQSNLLSVGKQDIQFEETGIENGTANDESHLEIALNEFSEILPVNFLASTEDTRSMAGVIASIRWQQLVARCSHQEVFASSSKRPTSNHLDAETAAREYVSRDSSGGVALAKNAPFMLELQGQLYRNGNLSELYANRDGLPPHDGDPSLPHLSQFIAGTGLNTAISDTDDKPMRHPICQVASNISIGDLIQAGSKYFEALNALIEHLASFAVETDFGYLPYTVSLKDEHAANRKAMSKYSGDHSQIKDLLRGRVIFPDEGSLVCALVRVFQLDEVFSFASNGGKKQVKLRIVRMKNLFSSVETTRPSEKSMHSLLPTGYRHVLLNVVFDDEFIAEIQFNILCMFAVLGDDGPTLHCEIRALKDACHGQKTADELLLASIEPDSYVDAAKLNDLVSDYGEEDLQAKSNTEETPDTPPVSLLMNEDGNLFDKKSSADSYPDAEEDRRTGTSAAEDAQTADTKAISEPDKARIESISDARMSVSADDRAPEGGYEDVKSGAFDGQTEPSDLTVAAETSQDAKLLRGEDHDNCATPEHGDTPVERTLFDNAETPKAGRTSRIIIDPVEAYPHPVALLKSQDEILKAIAQNAKVVPLKDIWKFLVQIAVQHINQKPRDTAALHCFLWILGFIYKMDYKTGSGTTWHRLSQLNVPTTKDNFLQFKESVLKRCLAISYQNASTGMIGWVATTENDAAAAPEGDRPLSILHEIGACLAEQEKWAEAEDVYRDLLVRCERLLPLYHPIVIASMLDLAACAMANAQIDLASKMIARACERVSAYLAEMEHSHATHYQQSLSQIQSGLLIFEIDSGRRALPMLEAFVDRVEKLSNRKLMTLLSPDHEVALAQRCILADSLTVLANCWTLREFSLSKKRSVVFWQTAFAHYRVIFRECAKLHGLEDTRVASAAYGCARCLRELGKLNEAFNILAPVAKALSHSYGASGQIAKQTLRFIPQPVSLNKEVVDQSMVAAQCQWLLAVLTADKQPDDEGRTKALRCLHKASIALRHILNTTMEDDPRRNASVKLLGQIEEEARRIFHPLRPPTTSTQTSRADRRG